MHRIILDTDLAMGDLGSDPDDGFALALAHSDPDIQIELITTVNGNTDVFTATRLTLELGKRLGIVGVPVVQGAAASFTHPERVRRPQPQSSMLGNDLSADAGFAAVEIVKLVMAHPGEITIVAIGPLTNVATAILLEPSLARNVKELVIMGGTFAGATGQGTAMPGEFNVWSDPEAAAAVLRSGAPQRWLGLDVTRKVRLTRDDGAKLLESAPESFSHLAGEATVAWIEHLTSSSPGLAKFNGSCAMHDPLAIIAVTHPELLTWQDAAVDVVTGDGIARGIMVTNLLFGRDAPRPNCRIAVEVNSPKATEFLLKGLSTL